MRDDHSPTLRAFHLIARYGSFTRAAADMEVTASALSQTMRQLEQRVGVRLLQRTTRKVGLTEAGRQFLERITPALAAIDGALDELRQHGDRPAGTLRVTVPEIVLDWLVAPLQADFLRRWPELTLDVGVTGGLVDLVAEGYDCGIRLGERLARDMVAVAGARGLWCGRARARSAPHPAHRPRRATTARSARRVHRRSDRASGPSPRTPAARAARCTTELSRSGAPRA